jgi:aminomethyltransferase
MKKTALHEDHCLLGARMAPFAGFEMPISYTTIPQEHEVVREKVGLFDVSHMGVINIRGEGAEEFIDYLVTNEIAGKSPGRTIYTLLCNEHGGVVDDILVFIKSPTDYFVVANASNVSNVLKHLQKQAVAFDVEVFDQQSEILALQGPNALELLKKVFPEIPSLKPMRFSPFFDAKRDISLIVSTTGYTGEKGVELFLSADAAKIIWKELLEQGKSFGIQPVGLGARDTLRLEMGFALYGHELTQDSSPKHSVSSWTIKWNKPAFLGKQALLDLDAEFQAPVVLCDKGVPRAGYKVLAENKIIGHVVSGTFSPSLKQGIALVSSKILLKEGDIIEIQVRKQLCKARVVTLPFLKKN